ncbi:hypothetical protein CRE_24343 [Caenorhabditis remanei]|uniref:Bromo domain-containing protein n=1 Tax=Caenorhabditis remanei TaxID=31234 RepID=E3NTL4_CAERE|nr:hypothetical protein CRE_24343 [Caenorhabditis remanei]
MSSKNPTENASEHERESNSRYREANVIRKEFDSHRDSEFLNESSNYNDELYRQVSAKGVDQLSCEKESSYQKEMPDMFEPPYNTVFEEMTNILEEERKLKNGGSTSESIETVGNEIERLVEVWAQIVMNDPNTENQDPLFYNKHVHKSTSAQSVVMDGLITVWNLSFVSVHEKTICGFEQTRKIPGMPPGPSRSNCSFVLQENRQKNLLKEMELKVKIEYIRENTHYCLFQIAAIKKQRKRKLAGLGENDDSMDDIAMQQRRIKPDIELQSKVNQMLAVILEYTDEDGEVIAEPFQTLPTKRELPEYYKEISQPMDFDRINRKLQTGRYATIDEVNDDMMLLVNNAQTFNEEDSEIYDNSKIIARMWKEQYDKVGRLFSESTYYCFFQVKSASKPAVVIKQEPQSSHTVPSQKTNLGSPSEAPPLKRIKREVHDEFMDEEQVISFIPEFAQLVYHSFIITSFQPSTSEYRAANRNPDERGDYDYE